MNKLFLLGIAVLISGCTLPNYVDTEQPMNSVGCIHGMYSGTWANGNMRGTRLRFPEGYDTSELNGEKIKELAEVLCR